MRVDNTSPFVKVLFFFVVSTIRKKYIFPFLVPLSLLGQGERKSDARERQRKRREDSTKERRAGKGGSCRPEQTKGDGQEPKTEPQKESQTQSSPSVQQQEQRQAPLMASVWWRDFRFKVLLVRFLGQHPCWFVITILYQHEYLQKKFFSQIKKSQDILTVCQFGKSLGEEMVEGE